jgi:hypothetical protein
MLRRLMTILVFITNIKLFKKSTFGKSQCIVVKITDRESTTSQVSEELNKHNDIVPLRRIVWPTKIPR